jgi:hypothetical protein
MIQMFSLMNTLMEKSALENLKAGETKTLEKTYFRFGAYNLVEPFTLYYYLKIK